jgi:hypothetical protein
VSGPATARHSRRRQDPRCRRGRGANAAGSVPSIIRLHPAALEVPSPRRSGRRCPRCSREEPARPSWAACLVLVELQVPVAEAVPWRPHLDDRHVTWLDVCLDLDLRPEVLRYALTTSELDPKQIDLWDCHTSIFADSAGRIGDDLPPKAVRRIVGMPPPQTSTCSVHGWPTTGTSAQGTGMGSVSSRSTTATAGGRSSASGARLVPAAL